jgi:hypothetical protein
VNGSIEHRVGMQKRLFQQTKHQIQNVITQPALLLPGIDEVSGFKRRE